MRRVMTMVVAMLLAMVAQAQTMHVVVGSVTYAFPAAQTGEMNFTDGTSLTIMGKTFAVSDVTEIYIDQATVTDNEVSVVYAGETASVTVAGNVAQYVSATVSGAHVMLEQSSTLDDAVGEIDYTLSGSSDDGEFSLSGSYKATVNLNGLTLTNPSGAAISIANGKRIDVSVKNGTVNTLTDGANGAQKACLYVKGHAEFKGKGTLHIYGNCAHGIKGGEYVTVKNCTINVHKAVKDGINCNEYFLLESGVVSIGGVGDDGIQVDLDGTSSTGEKTDHEGEDSGNVYLEGGSLTVSVSAAATKGVKAAGDLKISGGTIAVTTTGAGMYDTTERDAKGCAGLKSDGNMTISGGTVDLKSTGTGGKCIKCDGQLVISDGTVSAVSTGAQYKYSSSYTASAKAIKSDGAMTISGGTVTASSSSHEGIESKSTIDITGGYVYAYAKDDAINSASTLTVSGGYVMGNSTGNDGLDANGNCYIKGGTVFAVAARSPEVGIDANTEKNYKLYVQGGNIIAIGGLESGSSLTQTCYQSSNYTKGAWYGLYNGSTLVAAFKVPSNSSMGSGMVVSTAGTTALKTGITVSGGSQIWGGFGNVGGTVSGGSSVTLSTYTGNNGGPGGPGGRW